MTDAQESASGVDGARGAAEAALLPATKGTWGGLRRGAGRKPRPGRHVRHVERPPHEPACPVHITLRRMDGLPSLRSERVREEIVEAARATRFPGFRIVHVGVEPELVHMIVEANDDDALSAGIKAFAVRGARRVNRVLDRQGTFWAERHHRRELRTPRAVQDAVAHVTRSNGVGTSPVQPAETWLLEHARRRDQ